MSYANQSDQLTPDELERAKLDEHDYNNRYHFREIMRANDRHADIRHAWLHHGADWADFSRARA